MKIFDYIFISVYRFYRRNEDGGRFTHACVLTLIVGEILFLLLLMIQRLFKISIIGNIPSVVTTIFALGIMNIFYFYYSEARTANINESFEQKPAHQKRMWGWISVTLAIAPMIVLVMMLKKP